MKPISQAIRSITSILDGDPQGRGFGFNKLVIPREDVTVLLNEFQKLDARIRVEHNKERVENHQPLSYCNQCPNFHSYKQGGKRYGSCPVLGVVHEIPEDKYLKSIFDDLWCTFHGVENAKLIYTEDKSKKPEFTSPARNVKHPSGTDKWD